MAEVAMAEATLQVFRGDREGGKAVEYRCRSFRGWSCSMLCTRFRRIRHPISPCAGIARRANADRARPKSMAVRGSPARRVWMLFLSIKPITIFPMKTFPVIKDLVTDVSWNFKVNQKDPAVSAAARCRVEDVSGRRGSRARISQVHRVFSLPGCLPCPARSRQRGAIWRTALLCAHGSLEMHPLDGVSRTKC